MTERMTRWINVWLTDDEREQAAAERRRRPHGRKGGM